jgi:hypothetical protein
LDGTPIYELSPKDVRKFLSDLQVAEVAKLPAGIDDRNNPVGPNGQVFDQNNQAKRK